MSDGLDLDAIEARAQAATPGPWERRIGPREGYGIDDKAEYMRGVATDNGQPLHVLVADSPDDDYAYLVPALTGDGPTSEANAEHIAGMDPATTLALVSRLREAETQLAQVEMVSVKWGHRGHLAPCGHASGPCERCAKARAGDEILAILGTAERVREVLEPEVPARRRGKPGVTEPDTRGYMGGV